MVNGKLWDRMCEEKLKVLRKFPAHAKKLKVDAVLIAGDVFDTSNPPEALKAEFVKIIMDFECPVYIITGRPGDHDYVSKSNFVLMDIREALGRVDSNVYIHDTNQLHLSTGVMMFHDMLEGISDFYKNVVTLKDERFADYKTIMMGDYHAHYHTTYGQKFFIYPGPPFPTRYGESDHGLVVLETDSKTGKYIRHKYHKTKSYRLLDLNNLDSAPKCDVPYVARYNLTVPSQEVPTTLRACEDLKKELMMGEHNDSNCMDVVWKVKAENVTTDIDGNEIEDHSLSETCKNYIEKNSGNLKKSALSLLSKLEKAVE
jgi:DNA repair exonuclease SbcCD nuclease subunit